jgi:hypothetical protein
MARKLVQPTGLPAEPEQTSLCARAVKLGRDNSLALPALIRSGPAVVTADEPFPTESRELNHEEADQQTV